MTEPITPERRAAIRAKAPTYVAAESAILVLDALEAAEERARDAEADAERREVEAWDNGWAAALMLGRAVENPYRALQEARARSAEAAAGGGHDG